MIRNLDAVDCVCAHDDRNETATNESDIHKQLRALQAISGEAVTTVQGY